MQSYFQETGLNYVGTPTGILHTNKRASAVGMSDFAEWGTKPPTQNFKNKYRVSACDALLFLEVGASRNDYEYATHAITFIHNGQWLGL